jgi:hypothetical protein
MISYGNIISDLRPHFLGKRLWRKTVAACIGNFECLIFFSPFFLIYLKHFISDYTLSKQQRNLQSKDNKGNWISYVSNMTLGG